MRLSLKKRQASVTAELSRPSIQADLDELAAEIRALTEVIAVAKTAHKQKRRKRVAA